MALGALEIIALIFAVGVIIKLLIVSFSAKSWLGFVKGLYSKPMLLMLVELVLAIIVFYYLIQAMTLVQIIGGVLLGALLTGMTLAVYSKELMPAVMKMLKNGFLKKAWLPVLVWLVLAIWTLKEIFT